MSTTYTDFDLCAKLDLITIAQKMHDEDRAKCRDEGTCVLSAGICVWYKAPRKRNPVRKIVIEQAFQGNTGSWKAAQRALAFLKENGVDAFWYDGNMD